MITSSQSRLRSVSLASALALAAVLWLTGTLQAQQSQPVRDPSKINMDAFRQLGGSTTMGTSTQPGLPGGLLGGTPTTAPGPLGWPPDLTGAAAPAPRPAPVSENKPAATRPADTQPATAPAIKDELFDKARTAFLEGDYRTCADILKLPVREADAKLYNRMLYIATLVAKDNVSQAAYEAVRAAKANPAAFFSDRTLKDVYRNNADFAKHFANVEVVGRRTKYPEPGILWALYQHLQPNATPEDDPSVTLKLIIVPERDREWFNTLRDNCK